MSPTPITPRIPPLPPREWPREMRVAMAALVRENPRHPLPAQGGDRPKGLNALGTLAQHPELTRAFNGFNGHILFGTTLSLRQRELIVLRVADLRDCGYEWKQHVVQGSDAGISRRRSTGSDKDRTHRDGRRSSRPSCVQSMTSWATRSSPTRRGRCWP